MAKAKGTVSKSLVWVILGLLIVGLAGFGATNFGGSVNSLGRVGDTEIDVNRYVRALNNELRALSSQTGRQISFQDARQFGIDRAVLQRVVSTVAIEDEADDLGISVGDAAVAQEVMRIPSFQGMDGTFEREAYRFTLEQSGLSEAEFEESLRAELARTLVQGAVAGGTAPPPAYVDTVIAFLGERRSFSWIRLAPDVLGDPVPAPSEAELRAWYDENTDEYRLPETRQIAYAWLTPEMLVETVEVDEAALRALYEERSDEFNRPERRLVERLVFSDRAAAEAAKARIDAGEVTFEDIVAERGLDLADIDMGDVTRADLGAAGEAVFALEEPGVAGPVETDLGPALFRMNAILAAQETPFDEARPELIDEYAMDRARRVIADRIDPIDDLLAGGATVEELGDETEMRAGTIMWSQGVSEGIAAYEAFRRAARAAEPGDFPEILELEDGGIFALRLDEVIPPRPEPFDAARDRVAEDWRQARVRDRLAERAEALEDRIESGETLADLDRPVRTETGLTRRDFVPEAPAGLLERVFDMAEGDTAIVEGERAVALVRLDDVRPPDRDDPDLAERRASLERRLAQGLGQDMLDAYADAVEAEAGISLNQAAINAVHAQFN